MIVRGLFYAVCFAGFWYWVAVSIAPIDAQIPITIPALVRALGWPVAAFGAVLTAWCIGLFLFEGRGTPAPFDPPEEFVSAGPYAWLRNPMYVGALSVILGCGLVFDSPSIVALSVAFWLMAHAFVVLYEEPALEQQFGDSYRHYKHSVNRWMPGAPVP